VKTGAGYACGTVAVIVVMQGALAVGLRLTQGTVLVVGLVVLFGPVVCWLVVMIGRGLGWAVRGIDGWLAQRREVVADPVEWDAAMPVEPVYERGARRAVRLNDEPGYDQRYGADRWQR